MSEALANREKRARLRRQRLEENAGTRLEYIFTGSGFSVPHTGVREPHEPSPLPLPPIVTSSVRIPSPEQVEDPPVPSPSLNPSPSKPRTRKRPTDNQSQREAADAIKRAKLNSASPSQGEGIRLRVFLAFLHALVFVLFGYRAAVIVSLIVTDLSIATFSVTRSQGPTPLSLFASIPALKQIKLAYVVLQSLQKVFVVMGFFAFSVVLSASVMDATGATSWWKEQPFF